MSVPIVAAALGFLACLGGAFWLGRTRRERTAFAALIGAPLIAALAFAAVASLPPGVGAGQPPAAGGVAPAAVTAGPPAAATGAVGTEIDGWRHEAEQLRRARRFAEARVVYAKLVAAAPDDADAWADLADASAAAAGGDLEAGAAAIDHALQVDATHLKALWLKASLELQQKRYASAQGYWQRLLARLPPDSNDARIVNANIDETRTLASGQGAAPAVTAGDER